MYLFRAKKYLRVKRKNKLRKIKAERVSYKDYLEYAHSETEEEKVTQKTK